MKLHYSLFLLSRNFAQIRYCSGYLYLAVLFCLLFSPGPNLEVQEYNPTTLETEAGASQQLQGLSGLPRKF